MADSMVNIKDEIEQGYYFLFKSFIDRVSRQKVRDRYASFRRETFPKFTRYTIVFANSADSNPPAIITNRANTFVEEIAPSETKTVVTISPYAQQASHSG